MIQNHKIIKQPVDLIDYYLWMLSDESSSSNKIYIEYGDDLTSK